MIREVFVATDQITIPPSLWLLTLQFLISTFPSLLRIPIVL